MAERAEATRRIRDEADARVCLAAVDASGMRLYGWARANGIAVRSLGRWRERVALIDAQRARAKASARARRSVPGAAARRLPAHTMEAPRLVEVTVSTPQAAPGAARYDIVVGRYRVVVGDDFAEKTLSRLLRMVASC